MGLARLGCSLSALLLSIVTNGSQPHRVMAALYARKTNLSSFFLKFFFVGCGRSGVGACVWALGCGCVCVGARVGRWGRLDGDGRSRDEAGWIGIVSVGCVRESPPWAYPTRIRIGGSGVIDRPTFRLPGSQMRASLGWKAPHSPCLRQEMTRMPLGAHRRS